jgi:hypothetical protein
MVHAFASVLVAGTLVLGAVVAFRFATKAGQKDIVRKVESEGGHVVWVKRLQTELEAPFNRWGSFMLNDVLVEREGVRKIEVWRSGVRGAFRDH